MPASQSRLAYNDCQTFFDEAMSDDAGARLEFPDYGAAHQFRMRCHVFRDICRKDNKAIHTDPEHHLHGRSEYDLLKMVIRAGLEDNWWLYAEKLILDPGRVERLTPDEEPA